MGFPAGHICFKEKTIYTLQKETAELTIQKGSIDTLLEPLVQTAWLEEVKVTVRMPALKSNLLSLRPFRNRCFGEQAPG